MLVFKEKVLVLVEKVIDIDAIVIHVNVFDQELFLQELRHNEHHEDACETEERHVASEKEPMVEKVVGEVEDHIHGTEAHEGLVLMQLVELQHFF